LQFRSNGNPRYPPTQNSASIVFMRPTLLSSSAVEPVVIPLWPEGVPGARDIGPERTEEGGRIFNVSNPTLTVYGPAIDRPNGTAVIICPGGGYGMLSFAREGIQFANWLSTLGVTAFILKSRLGEFGHPAPLQDVLRAIRIVRSRAGEFGVRSGRIGVMGSSAGGHLAASAATLFEHAAGKTGAALDAVSGRPDFQILMYPVITMDDPAAHAGSRENLIGAHPSPEARQLMSIEKQVTAATPAGLIIHTQEDQSVAVDNALLYFQALTRAGVPGELYVFEHGVHGMGMKEGFGTASEWPKRAEEWLRGRGLLNSAKP
jgi:acetyl esterase/lipase